jgi:hypothetical protein
VTTSLDAGNYFVQVIGQGGDGSDYSITISLAN